MGELLLQKECVLDLQGAQVLEEARDVDAEDITDDNTVQDKGLTWAS